MLNSVIHAKDDNPKVFMVDLFHSNHNLFLDTLPLQTSPRINSKKRRHLNFRPEASNIPNANISRFPRFL